MDGRKLILVALALAGLGTALYVHRHNRGAGSRSVSAKQHGPAPDFTLPRLDGGQLQLSSYRGKVVLLDFWATWCVPCREETPHFVEMQQKFGDRGLQIVGVSMDDSTDPVREFQQKFRINYPIVMGTADMASSYGGVLGLPIAFVINRDGTIYSKHIGATDATVFDQEVATLLEK